MSEKKEFVVVLIYEDEWGLEDKDIAEAIKAKLSNPENYCKVKEHEQLVNACYDFRIV